MSFTSSRTPALHKALYLQSPQLTPRPLHFYKALRGASLSSRPSNSTRYGTLLLLSHNFSLSLSTTSTHQLKMKFTNINLLLSASATTVIITAPLISAQVSLSDSICFVALFVNSISLSYMCVILPPLPFWLRLSFSLSISISYDRLLVPHRGSSTLSTRKAIKLLLSTI